MTADELRDLHGFHRWARGRLLDAAERLPAQDLTRAPEPGVPSLRDGLVRLLWTDWVWLRRFFGLSPRIVFDPDDYPDVAAVRAKWAEVDDEMRDLLGPLTDAGTKRRVDYRDVRGGPHAAPLGRLLLHLVERGSQGRAELAAALRGMGAKAPEPCDLLTYWGEGTGPTGGE